MPAVQPQVIYPQTQRRRDYLNAFNGVLDMNFPPQMSTVAQAATSQTLWAVPFWLYAGEVVTNVIVAVHTLASGTAPTAIKLALYDATPTCKAVTADLSADARWTSVGYKVNALGSPFTVAATGMHYGVFWMNGVFGTNNAFLSAIGLTSIPEMTGQIGGAGAYMFPTLGLAVTTISVSDAGTFGTANSRNFWMALS